MKNHKPDNELAREALVDCPTCGLPAEIIDRFILRGTPRPIEHVKILCVRRHWYTLPVDTFPVSAPALVDISSPRSARADNPLIERS